MEKAIIGLGNPGIKYESTRHNIGWMVFERLDCASDLVWREKFKGLFASKGAACFLKPLVYMNLSGESAALLVNFFKLKVEDVLVVYDDVDIPFGTLVLKQGGGTGGHNGLKSLVEKLGGNTFNRLRLGVGRPEHGSMADYVLQKFSSEEQAVLPDFLLQGAKAVGVYLEQGFQTAAAEYSKKSVI